MGESSATARGAGDVTGGGLVIDGGITGQ